MWCSHSLGRVYAGFAGLFLAGSLEYAPVPVDVEVKAFAEVNIAVVRGGASYLEVATN